MTTLTPSPTLHLLLAVTSTATAEIDWPALRREAGERDAIISLLVLDGDRSIVLVPALTAAQAPMQIQEVRPQLPSTHLAWRQVANELFAARAAINSLQTTRVVLFGGSAEQCVASSVLDTDPSIEIVSRAIDAKEGIRLASQAQRRKTSATGKVNQRQHLMDRAQMEHILPIGSEWLKKIGGRFFGVRFDQDGLSEWLADNTSESWRGDWALTPGDDTGGLDTLLLETRVGDYYSRLLWRGTSFVGKEFVGSAWQDELSLIDKAKGYYYFDDRYPDVTLEPQ